MNFRSLSDMSSAVWRLSWALPKFDAVIGVPRSGMIAASMFAQFRNIPWTTPEAFLEGAGYEGGRRMPKGTLGTGRFLILDDSSGNGGSISAVRTMLEPKNVKLTTAAVYVTEESKKLVNHYVEVVPTPRVFEWNILNARGALRHGAMDIDGLLCPDPTPQENDDGKRYLDFLTNAPCIWKPSFKVNVFITSRLEKYRKETKEWLRKHGIEGWGLLMAQYLTAEERRKANHYAEDKAREFAKRPDLWVFYESHPQTAEKIAAISRKLVYCPGHGHFQFER